MPAQIPIIRIFVSSPGDVNDERKISLDVVEQFPYRPVFREKVAFRVVAWDKPGADTAMRATLTPQEAINQGLPKPSECDIVIVMLWSRMGTPFKDVDGEEYLSGTHWELLDALDSEQTETLIYRRTEEKLFRANEKANIEQYERVQTFFQSDLFYREDGSILRGVNQYETPEDFRQAFNTHLEELVVKFLGGVDNNLITPAEERTPSKVDGHNVREIESIQWNSEQSPFPGLRSFTEEDASIFFGRGYETDALVKQVAQSPFVAVVGASGSGKSSLVGAGLIPRLRERAIEGSHTWDIVSFTPSEQVYKSLAGVLMETIPSLAAQNDRTFASERTQFANDLTEEIDHLRTTVERILKNAPRWQKMVLFIDQFEELFTLTPTGLREKFIATLAKALEYERIQIVVTLRADFYHRAMAYPELAQYLNMGTFNLIVPRRDALRDIIESPADRAGLEIESGLVERILDDTGDEPGNLALMAYLLDELYRLCQSQGELTHEAYDSLGGVEGAIGERAETVFNKIEGSEVDKTRAVQSIFSELVDVDVDGNATRRRFVYAIDKESELVSTIVEALIDARLLTSSQNILDVAHEALLRKWVRLANWIEREQDNLRLRRQIMTDASNWENNNRSKDLLYRGGILEEAMEWLDHKRDTEYLLKGGRLTDAESWQKRFRANDLENTFIEESLTEQTHQQDQERELQEKVEARLRLVLALAAPYTIVTLLSFWTTLFFILNTSVGVTKIEFSRVGQGMSIDKDLIVREGAAFFSSILTDEARDRAENSISPIYDPPDPSVALRQTQTALQMLEMIDNIRSDQLTTFDQKIEDINQIEALVLDDEEILSLLQLTDDSWSSVRDEVTSVLERVMRQSIRQTELQNIRDQLPTQVSIRFTQQESLIITSFVYDLVRANTFENPEKTTVARQAARDAVSDQLRQFSIGEVIVPRNKTIDALDYEALGQLGANVLSQPLINLGDSRLAAIVSGLLLSGLLFIGVGVIQRIYPNMSLFRYAGPIISALLFLTAFISMFTILPQTLLPQSFNSLASLAIGSVPTIDVVSPRYVNFVSEALTDEARDRAENSISPIYDPPDPSVALRQTQTALQMLEMIDNIRSDQLTTFDQKIEDINQIEALVLDDEEILSLLQLTDDSWSSVRDEVTSVLERVMRQSIRQTELQNIRDQLPTQVSIRFTQQESLIITSFVYDLVRANTFENPEKTTVARQAARDAVFDRTRTIVRGQVIAPKHELVDEVTYEALLAINISDSYFAGVFAYKFSFTVTYVVFSLILFALLTYVKRAGWYFLPRRFIHAVILALFIMYFIGIGVIQLFGA